jgi:hypothetical protein
LRLGTKLTLYLSRIIIVVLSGYGHLHILSRRDILVRKTKGEVRKHRSYARGIAREDLSAGRERVRPGSQDYNNYFRLSVCNHESFVSRAGSGFQEGDFRRPPPAEPADYTHRATATLFSPFIVVFVEKRNPISLTFKQAEKVKGKRGGSQHLLF